MVPPPQKEVLHEISHKHTLKVPHGVLPEVLSEVPIEVFLEAPLYKTPLKANGA